ncbi:MAG: hypothetical protein NVS1B2_17660 [Vulcanimicrobiaceae bacterium]
MAMDDIDDGGAIDLERKRGISPWVIFSIALVVIGVVFGVRRARSAKKALPDVSDGGDMGDAGRQPS